MDASIVSRRYLHGRSLTNSERPGNRPSVFIVFHDQSLLPNIQHAALSTTFEAPFVFLGSQFHCKLHKNYVLPQRRVYFCCYAPPKISSGFWLRFATEPAILFHHFNLRTVFAVISHTSAFRCMYLHCHALA